MARRAAVRLQGREETRTLRVVRVRDDDADQPPVLVVEDAAG
jgi:hypothetical protein